MTKGAVTEWKCILVHSASVGIALCHHEQSCSDTALMPPLQWLMPVQLCERSGNTRLSSGPKFNSSKILQTILQDLQNLFQNCSNAIVWCHGCSDWRHWGPVVIDCNRDTLREIESDYWSTGNWNIETTPVPCHTFIHSTFLFGVCCLKFLWRSNTYFGHFAKSFGLISTS